MGRPLKAGREKRGSLVCARVNISQHRAVIRAAKKARLSVSDYVWRALQVALRS